jgi:iron(III) transport system substrate-binding protein
MRQLGKAIYRASGVILLAAMLCSANGVASADDLPFPGADQKLVAAARAEGQLTLYVNQDTEIANTTVQAFKRAVPGIDVRLLRLATVQLFSRVSAEFGLGVNEVDVLGTADMQTFTEHNDWWQEIDSTMIPNLSQLPKSAIMPNYFLASQSVNIIAYNKTMLSGDNVPKTWPDFLKPEYKGKGLLVDPRNSTTYVSWLDYKAEVYGEQFLVKLRQQNFLLVSAGSPGVQEVAAGGAAFVFPVTKSHVIPLIDKGAPIGTIEPWDHSDVAAILVVKAAQNLV